MSQGVPPSSSGGVPARRPNPPWWFFAAIGIAIIAAATIFIVRSGGDDQPTILAPSPASTPSTEPAPTGPSVTAALPSPTVEVTPTGPTGATSGGVALGASCFSSEGFGIGYPEGWFTPTQPAWVCQLFDPQPFTVQRHTEPPIVAVSVYVERVPLTGMTAAYTDPEYYDVISSQPGTFADADRPGTVVETVQTQDLFFPVGTRTYAVLVDLLDRTIVVSTNDLASTDYEQNKQLVLAMAESLSLAG